MCSAAVGRGAAGGVGECVVLGAVGCPMFDLWCGRLVAVWRVGPLGEVVGEQVEMNLAEILYREEKLMGSTGAQRRHTEEAARMVTEGLVNPVIHATMPLKDALMGLGWMEERRLFGRVVLVPG